MGYGNSLSGTFEEKMTRTHRRLAWPLQRWLVLALVIVVLSFGGAVRGDDDLRDGESVTETKEAFPGAVPLDADGEETLWCVRIVDADKRPIPGARVSVPWHPGWGAEEEQHYQCAATADWDGWVRLPWPAVNGWVNYVFADAPGYAANEYCEPGDTECVLQRGTDVPVVLLDYVGRPVPNARIALNLGCGHVPDQRTAVTNADGRAVLRDILPSRHRDIWVEAPHCHRGTTRMRRTWRVGDPPVAIDTSPGLTTSGRILGKDGTPVPYVVVGASDRHRPVTTTDRDGRFELVGVSAWSEIEFYPPPTIGFKGAFMVPPEGVERVLTLGAATTGIAVTVQCVDSKGEPTKGVRAALVRTSDGLTASVLCDKQGQAVLDVAPGQYRVLADGELGTWGSGEVAIDVAAGQSPSIKVVVPRNPTVRVNASRVADLRVGLTTRRGFRRLTFDGDDLDNVEVPVPVDERAVFRISGTDGELLVSYVDAPAPGGFVTLDWVPVTRVTARLVGPDGRPVPGVLTLQRERGLEDSTLR